MVAGDESPASTWSALCRYVELKSMFMDSTMTQGPFSRSALGTACLHRFPIVSASSLRLLLTTRLLTLLRPVC